MNEPRYNIHDVAARLKVSQRQAQNVCRSVLGRRTRYRLTDEEMARVALHHDRFGYGNGESGNFSSDKLPIASQ